MVNFNRISNFSFFFSGRNEYNDSKILSQWTRTEPEPVIFHLSESEPNLNRENGAQVNPNQTWTAKIFWAEAKSEPEPLFETVRHPDFSEIQFFNQAKASFFCFFLCMCVCIFFLNIYCKAGSTVVVTGYIVNDILSFLISMTSLSLCL